MRGGCVVQLPVHSYAPAHVAGLVTAHMLELAATLARVRKAFNVEVSSDRQDPQRTLATDSTRACQPTQHC